MPTISVLLPVRDAGPYLAAALASMWRQTFDDFEVVAVDDGSTDGSGEALDRVARHEPRLRVLHRPASGLPAALNTGLAVARGRLIARQDADDLSHRRRFELQRGFLSAHPRVGVVGSRVRIFPASGAWVGMRRWAAWHNALLDHETMAREVLVDSPLAHGTALFRRTALERVGGWAERGWPEDVDLWLRLIAAGVKLGKLPRVLYSWRQHAGSATRRQSRYSEERFDALRMHALRRGLLAGSPAVTVVGIGRGLRRWCGRLEAGRYRVRPVAEGRPAPARAARLEPPALLVFGAPPVRDRWRAALLDRGWVEGREFAFIV